MTTCIVDGCDKPRFGHGWCNTHYMRWYRAKQPPRSKKPRPVSPIRECGVDGCTKPPVSRGWCHTHYLRWYKTGTTQLRSRSRPSEERFLLKVQKGESCWLWTAAKTHGYGLFWNGTRQVPAHKFSYEFYVGPVPEGLQLDHLCRVRACVNPLHLEPVTCRENLLRGAGRTAINAARTHCPYGHPYSGDNLYLKPNGNRECRTCNARRRAERTAVSQVRAER
jgi:hypothetical protein